MRASGAHPRITSASSAGHGETIGNLAQCRYRLWRTMAIGVGLDHGEGLALGCALFGEQVVVTKRGQVDRGNQRTHGTVPVQRRVRLESYSLGTTVQTGTRRGHGRHPAPTPSEADD